jgi:hypothetical protein
MNRLLLFVIISFLYFPLFGQKNSNSLLLEIDKTIESNSYIHTKKNMKLPN